MNKEEVQLKAFQIIAAAGEALGEYYDAILAYKQKNWETAKERVKKGDARLTEAHLIQTELIRAEVAGNDLPGSLILTHSQDHLVQAQIFEKIAKLLIEED